LLGWAAFQPVAYLSSFHSPGSASPMESNYAFAEFSGKRIQLLNDRLKKLGIEPGK